MMNLFKFGFLDGYKSHILGAFAIIAGALKLLGVEGMEDVNILGVSDGWAMVTTGWGVIAARSAVKKASSETPIVLVDKTGD